MDLVPFEGHLRLLPPIFLGWLAWIVWRTPYQERANRLLALFLIALAVGFVFELLWVLRIGPRVLVRDLQSGFGLLDPPLLLAFALVFRAPFPALGRALLGVGYAALGFVLWFGQLGSFNQPTDALAFVNVLYVNGTYLAAFLILISTYMDERRAYLSRQLAFLSVGVGFAAISRSHALFFSGGPSWARINDPYLQVLGGVLLATIIVLVVAAVLGLRHGRVRSPNPLLWATAGLLVSFYAVVALMAALQDLTRFTQFRSLFFGLRWIVFALVVGFGVLRYQLFDLDLRMRQAGAMLASAVLAVVSAMVVGAGAVDLGVGLVPARLAGLLVALALLGPVYWLADRVLAALLPETDSPARFAMRRLEIYQTTLEYALAKKDWTEDERRFVETLREVFEVTPEEHLRVVARLQTAAAG